MGVRRGVWTAGNGAAAEPDACEKEEDLSLSVGTDGLVLSLIFGVVVFGLDAFFSAAAAAASVEAEVLSLSLTIETDGGGERRLLAVVMLLLLILKCLISHSCRWGPAVTRPSASAAPSPPRSVYLSP